MNEHYTKKEQEQMKKRYYKLKKEGTKNKEYETLQKEKLFFLTPTNEEQKEIIEAFKKLLKKQNFNKHLKTHTIKQKNLIYQTEILEKHNMINIYITNKKLLPELQEDIKKRTNTEALSFLVHKGKQKHKNKQYDIRIGAYATPCDELTKALIGL